MDLEKSKGKDRHTEKSVFFHLGRNFLVDLDRKVKRQLDELSFPIMISRDV